MNKRFKKTVKNMDEPSRRDLAGMFAKTCLGVSMLPAVANATRSKDSAKGVNPGGKAKNMIFLYMSGGMTHMDTFDFHQDADPGYKGPTEGIGTSISGYKIGAQLGQKLADNMKHMAVINSMGTTTGDHGGGNYYMHTAYSQRGSIRHPNIGSWILRLDGWNNKVLPGAISIGGGNNAASPGFMPNKYAALPLANARSGLPNSKMRVSSDEFNTRLALADAFDKPFRSKYKQKAVKSYTGLYQDAMKLMTSDDLEVFDIRKESQETQEAYGMNGFGQGCLLARRLIEQDVRYVEVNLGGWDTHNNNFTAMDTRLPTLGNALGSLLEDLANKGLLDETLVVLATEFGRTPRINANQGRDHYPAAFSALIGGGGIKAGQVYGKTNKNGTKIIEDKVSAPDLHATIGHALGLNLDEAVHSPSGRPFTMAAKGKPIKAFF